MNIRFGIAVAVATVALLATSTVSFAQAPSQFPDIGSAGPRSYDYQKLEGSTLRIESAKLVCLHKIQIAAQADGLIDELLATEGDTVQAGDIMLRIDNRVAKAELDVAQKELEAAQKQAEQLAEVKYAKAASSVSDSEYKAEYELYQKGSSTFSQAQRKQLEAQRARLGIEVAEVKHETEGLAAEVAAAKVKAAEVQLGLYDVKAPYDGIIVKRERDLGEWIRAGEPVLKLVHMNEMKVETYVELKGFSVADLENAPVRVIVPINGDRSVEAPPTTIDFVSPEVESGRVRISAKIQNEKLGDSWLLRDGMLATLVITLPQR